MPIPSYELKMVDEDGLTRIYSLNLEKVIPPGEEGSVDPSFDTYEVFKSELGNAQEDDTPYDPFDLPF